MVQVKICVFHPQSITHQCPLPASLLLWPRVTSPRISQPRANHVLKIAKVYHMCSICLDSLWEYGVPPWVALHVKNKTQLSYAISTLTLRDTDYLVEGTITLIGDINSLWIHPPCETGGGGMTPPRVDWDLDLGICPQGDDRDNSLTNAKPRGRWPCTEDNLRWETHYHWVTSD